MSLAEVSNRSVYACERRALAALEAWREVLP